MPHRPSLNLTINADNFEALRYRRSGVRSLHSRIDILDPQPKSPWFQHSKHTEQCSPSTLIDVPQYNTNLLSIPSEVIGIFALLALTWFSREVNERSFVAMLQNIWVMPCLIALRVWPGVMQDQWGTFALITTLLSYPYCHAIVVAWVSQNSGSVRTRSVSAALYNVMVQIGNVYAANIYRADDKPVYHRGNSVLLALNTLAILLFVVAKVYYVYKNRSRDRKWNAMTEEQRRDYIENTTDEGNKRLDFRFAH